MSLNQSPTLLAIYAHPDDESFGPGGTLARYAAEGVAVHVAIVTDGAAGDTDDEFLAGYTSIAERRAVELAEAGDALNVTVHQLGYRDSGMEGSEANNDPASLYQAPLETVACRIVALIRELRPQVLLTHDPTGIYYHPDHIKVHHAVNLAWQMSGDPDQCRESGLSPWQPERLFWNVISDRWLKRMISTLRFFRQDPTQFGRNGDIDLTRLGTPHNEITTHVDVSGYLAAKRAASAAHASQGGGDPMLRRLPLAVQRRFLGKEQFVQAQPATPIYATDIFEGLISGPKKESQ